MTHQDQIRSRFVGVEADGLQALPEAAELDFRKVSGHARTSGPELPSNTQWLTACLGARLGMTLISESVEIEP
jgi:hypothetical protein